MRATLVVSENCCADVSVERWTERSSWADWRVERTVGTEERVDGCENMALRWEMGS
jgi:hypothetical protein